VPAPSPRKPTGLPAPGLPPVCWQHSPGISDRRRRQYALARPTCPANRNRPETGARWQTPPKARATRAVYSERCNHSPWMIRSAWNSQYSRLQVMTRGSHHRGHGLFSQHSDRGWPSAHPTREVMCIEGPGFSITRQLLDPAKPIAVLDRLITAQYTASMMMLPVLSLPPSRLEGWVSVYRGGG
jgi:hypothetical protein